MGSIPLRRFKESNNLLNPKNQEKKLLTAETFSSNLMGVMKINKYQTILVITTALCSSLLTLLVGAVLAVIFIIQPFNKEAVDRGFATWEVTDNSTGQPEELGWGASKADSLTTPQPEEDAK